MFDKQCEIRRKHFLSDFPFFHFRDTPNVGRACGFALPLLRPRLSRGWSQWPGGTLHSPVNGGSPGRRGPSPSSSPCLSLLGWGEDQLLIPEPPSPQAHRIPLCWGAGHATRLSTLQRCSVLCASQATMSPSVWSLKSLKKDSGRNPATYPVARLKVRSLKGRHISPAITFSTKPTS